MADKYALPPYVHARVRYYDGTFLQDEAFIAEQTYHMDRRQRDDRLLHVAGISEGLTVTVAAGAKSLLVAAGTALDDSGNQILVDATRTVPIAAGLNGTFWIELLFREKEDR